jgi:hypothetical protein
MIARLLLLWLWLWLGLFRVTERAGLTLRQVRQLPAAVDVTTAARALSMSRSSLYEAIAENRCPVQTITVGRRIRVLTHSLIAVLEGQGGQAA